MVELKAMAVRRAIISVFDKRGVGRFAKELQELGVEILSTGGTAKVLKKGGIQVKEIPSLTGFSEMLDGRVKTLHPVLYAGILARRDNKKDLEGLARYNIKTIDMVVCNLYPFESVTSQKVSLERALENIDIGGPTLLRASAKNFKDVVVVVDPGQYKEIIKELSEKGDLGEQKRKELALKAFAHTARYDGVIAHYLRRSFNGDSFPRDLVLPLELVKKTRYGENPHQRGAFYKVLPAERDFSLANARQLHGKMLSYNNLLDVSCAVECINEFEMPTTVVVKHDTPCGIASAHSLEEAWKHAWKTDTASVFGGIVAFNREVTEEAARELSRLFIEVIIAPGFSGATLELLERKKNIRLLEFPDLFPKSIAENREGSLAYRSILGGLLVQDRDTKKIDPSEWKTVTKKKPTKRDLDAMVFAVKCVRHLKSNAVVFVKGTRTVAIGEGQTSRVGASLTAILKGKKKIKGSVMASDGFFPFRDAVEVAAEAGVRVLVQPGGSIRDKKVIGAANEYKIKMVFTGQRYFRH